jgi:CheY-like chemotaxis protein
MLKNRILNIFSCPSLSQKHYITIRTFTEQPRALIMNGKLFTMVSDIFILVIVTVMKKIIIAADIYEELRKEQSFLNRSDMKTFTAVNNEEVLAIHKTEKADLIVTKLDTPSMNGETLCSLVRQDHDLSRVSVLIVCSNAPSDHERCLKCQANSFFAIPINNPVLLQEMYQLLQVSPRMSCRIPISVKIDGTLRKMPFTAHIENISISGILFRTAAYLSEGDTITCTFSLPGSSRVTVNAEIVRVVESRRKKEPHVYGVKFIDLSLESLSAIEAFVEKECQPA